MIAPTEIIFHHIRNCTEKLTYCGMNFLIDPFFTPKGYYPGFEMCPTKEQKEIGLPMVDLPISIDEILKDIVAILVLIHMWTIGMNTPQSIYQKIFQFLCKMPEIKN